MTSSLDRHRERFRADPDQQRAFEALEEHLYLAGDWPELIELYERRLTARSLEGDARGRGELLYRLAQVWEDRCGETEKALAGYERALRADPRQRPALGRLRGLHAAAGRWEVALQLAEMEAELPMTPAERAALLTETGGVWLDHLSQPEPALAQFERALGDDPAQVEAAAGAARACEALGRSAEAAAAWGRCAGLQRGSARAAALAAQARLTAGPLGQPEPALELYRRALAEDPHNPDALEAVAAHAAQRGQWPLLAELAERRFSRAAEPARRLEVALEAGRVQLDQLGNRRAARLWLAKAAELGPRDARVWEALADVERDAGDDAALLRCLDQLLALRADAAPTSALLESAALLSDRGDDEGALERLERALARDPDDVLVVEALSEALARLGRDEELADVLERRAALATADPATRASVLCELGALQDECLGNPEAARHAYERAHQADPSAPGLTAALQQIYRKTEAWDALRSLLESASRRGPAAERAGWLCALAKLLEEPFGQPGDAMRAYESALEIDPGATAVHRELQRLAEASGDSEALLRALEREAPVADPTRLAEVAARLAELLEQRGRPEPALAWLERWVEAAGGNARPLSECARLYEQLGRDEALVATLERLDALLPRAEQPANRRRLAAHHAARGRRDAAIRAYESALEADPHDLAALEALVVELDAAERVEELARARRWLADILPPERRAQCLDELAVLLDERLGDVDGAIDALMQLNDEAGAPADVDVRLEDLLERAGRHAELVVRLRARAHALPAGSPDAIALELRRAGVLLDPLGRFEDAAAVFREVRRRDPASRAAREGLERALRAAGDPEALEAFLAERVAEEDEPEARERAALERAVLLDDVLERAEEARALYASLCASARDPVVAGQAGDRLDALLERTGAWAALREHLEASLDDARPDAVARRERLGRLCRDRLADPAGAIAHFERAAALAPGRAAVWRDLARLYEAADRPPELVRALEGELATQPDAQRELALRVRAAQLLRAEDPEAARAHYQRLLELDPEHPAALEFSIECWEREGRFDAIAVLLEERLAALDGAPREPGGGWESQRAGLRLRIAELRDRRLDDLDGAIAALEPGLGEIGPQPLIAEPLADLYRRAGYLEDLIELSRNAAASRPEGPERANWLVRLGEALRERGDARSAAAAYRQALTERPDDRDAQAVLRGLYRELGEHEALARLLEEQLAQLGGPEEIPVRLELAELLAGPLAAPADALPQLRRVLGFEPAHARALEGALAIAEGAGQRELALELLTSALAQALHAPARAALLLRRAQLLAGDPPQLAAAAAALREALSLDPSRSEARGELRRVLEALRDWDSVLQCLYQEARDAEPPERAALLERAVGIAWQELSPDAALPWLERLRRERPDDDAVAARVAEAHRLARRPEALLRALDQQLACTPDARARRDLYSERARILEGELGSPARAAAELEAAHRADPEDREILVRLEALYRGLGRARDRLRVLEALIPGAGPTDRPVLLCEAAALRGGPLGDAHGAAIHLLTAVAEAPREGALRVELLRALGVSLRVAGPVDAWVRCAEEELRVLDPQAPVFAERRGALQRELAEAYERQLGRPDRAREHLRALLDVDDGGDDPPDEDAEREYLRLLRASGSWIELEQRLAARLERGPGDAAGWIELARLRDERLRAPAAAAAAYRQAVALDPDSRPALRGLRGLAERLGDWPEVARILEAEIARAGSPDERAGLLQRLGDVCWRRLQSTTRASRSYAAALEADPHDLAALRSFEQLLESMEDWRGALELYESEVAALGDREPERRREVWLRAGEIARDRTDEPQRARRAFARAAEIEPLTPGRRAELAELHWRCGDPQAFCESFGDWCDDPAAAAGAGDHVRLAAALEEIGRADEARDRLERALERDPQCASAWDALARLREAAGDAAGAREALLRVSELVSDGDAAERLLRAARLCRADDRRAAAELLRAAAERDPGSAGVQALLACLSEELGDHDAALDAAGRALDLAPGGGLEPPRLEVALAGARAARALGAGEEAARLFAAARAEAPERPDVLAGLGETLAELGDLAAARDALEARLAHGDAYPERARHLAIAGQALAATGDADAARERLEAALAADPDLDDAYAPLVALHELAGRIDDGVACLEQWADRAASPEARAEHLMRAAEWELRAGDRNPSAERHLREVLEVEPRAAAAWCQLATLLWEAGRSDDALDVASRALSGEIAGLERAPLALIRGRALERSGGAREAAAAYAEATAADPDCSEAALARARLLRGLGEWSAAAEVLREFAEGHDGADARALAEVHHQLGRLLAGPLEDLSGAIGAYRSAIDLDPERDDSRAALGDVLAHSSDDWREAAEHHRARLDEDPASAGAIRALVRIARERAGAEAAAGGLALLRALGAASPAERDAAPERFPFAGGWRLDDPLGEKLRRVAAEARGEIAAALGASQRTAPTAAGNPRLAFRAAVLEAEGELAGPALLPLTDEELAEVLTLVCALALEPESVRGEGRLVNALSAALGRRARKRLRRCLGDLAIAQVERFDFAAWRGELHALAVAVALEQTGAPLRTGLIALLDDEGEASPEPIAESADLTPRIAASPRALALLRRAVRHWLRSF